MSAPCAPPPCALLSLAEQRLLAVLPAIMELERGEVLRAGAELGSLHLDTSPCASLPIRLLTPAVFAAAHGADRSEVDHLLWEALPRLAHLRAWRLVATPGPPASFLPSDLLRDALVHAGIVQHQELVDRVHRAVVDQVGEAIGRVRWPVHWASDGIAPPLASISPQLRPHIFVRQVRGEPWLAGQMSPQAVEVTGYARGRIVIGRSRDFIGDGRQEPTYEIRTTTLLPEIVAIDAAGRPVADIVDEQLVRSLGGTVLAATTMADGTRVRVLPGDVPAPAANPDHMAELNRQTQRAISRMNAIAGELTRAIRGG